MFKFIKKRKNIIFTVLVIIGIIFYSLYTEITNQTNQTNQKADTNSLEKNIQDPIDRTIGLRNKAVVTWEIDEDNLNLPIDLPYYSTFFALEENKEKINVIAQKIGFKESAYETQDATDGLIMIWDNPSLGHLWAAPELDRIEYKIPIEETFVEPGSLKDINELDYINKAKNKLISTGIVANPDELTNAKVEYLTYGIEGAAVTSKNKANLIRAIFPLQIGEYEVVDDTYAVGSISVLSNEKGNIQTLIYDGINKITQTGTLEIKNFDEIKNVFEKESQLISIGGGSVGSLNTDWNKKVNVTIKTINIAYLQKFNNENQYIMPIFVLKGITSEGYEAVFYLPASK